MVIPSRLKDLRAVVVVSSKTQWRTVAGAVCPLGIVSTWMRASSRILSPMQIFKRKRNHRILPKKKMKRTTRTVMTLIKNSLSFAWAEISSQQVKNLINPHLPSNLNLLIKAKKKTASNLVAVVSLLLVDPLTNSNSSSSNSYNRKNLNLLICLSPSSIRSPTPIRLLPNPGSTTSI